MNAIRLHHPNGKPADVWQCGKCGTLAGVQYAPIGVGGRTLTHEERLPYVQASAERCCNWRCDKCGEKAPPHFSICNKCRSEKQDAERSMKEQESFAKSKDVTGSYDGPFMFDDRFFASMEDVLEHCHCNDMETPEYLWVPREYHLSMDADHIIENAVESHYHDAMDRISTEQVKELQGLLDKWCEATGIVSYEEMHKEYVRLPAVAIEEDRTCES